MINSIISAISNAIYDTFGDGYEIYKESVEQGLNEPCFLISNVSRKNNQFLSCRYKEANLFTVQYFPSTTNIRQECNDVAERLENCLELIQCDGNLVRGTNINSQIVDDILNFSVNYDYFTIKASDNADMMEDISITQHERN